MAIRAKMRCSNITTTSYGGAERAHVVRFDAVYDQSIPEDRRFQKATPTGHIEMRVDNPHALEAFQPGRSYYIDFTTAE